MYSPHVVESLLPSLDEYVAPVRAHRRRRVGCELDDLSLRERRHRRDVLAWSGSGLVLGLVLGLGFGFGLGLVLELGLGLVLGLGSGSGLGLGLG